MTANGVTVGFSCPGAGGPPYPCVSATVP
jgi:hypothetical protein